MSFKIDLAGKRFGRLVAVRYVAGDGRKAWLCQCDCGASSEVPGMSLRSGKSLSCGCFKKEKLARGLRVRHGMCKTPTYKSWDSMMRRCTSPNDPSYSRYGGAGISVCTRWTRYDEFFADMGERPDGKTIDRIDGNGNYSPENCRWATRREQSNNLKNNRKIEYQGSPYTAREIADLTGASYPLLRDRIFRLGWTVERAISTPAAIKSNNQPNRG